MKTSIFSFSLALLALGSMSVPAAIAQSTTPGEDPFVSNSVDPSKQGLGNGFDPMSLIHNANLSRSRNGADFAEDAQRNINSAADQFKQLQQQRVLEMQQQQSQPVVAPDPVTP